MAAVVKWLTHWIVAPARVGSIPTGRPIISQGYSSIGRATVSKTVGCELDSYCPCHFFTEQYSRGWRGRFAKSLGSQGCGGSNPLCSAILKSEASNFGLVLFSCLWGLCGDIVGLENFLWNLLLYKNTFLCKIIKEQRTESIFYL